MTSAPGSGGSLSVCVPYGHEQCHNVSAVIANGEDLTVESISRHNEDDDFPREFGHSSDCEDDSATEDTEHVRDLQYGTGHRTLYKL